MGSNEGDRGKVTGGVVGVPSGSEFSSQLKWYYAKYFPIALYYRWLSYGDVSYFSRREISFTLPNDVYLRFRSFTSAEELHATLKDRLPIKMDIGAVYNLPPREKANYGASLVPLEKELVIDIDMTDYKDVMGDLAEGSEVEVCDNNWPYMAAAVKIVDTALREDFGFRHILWVYSGRRGVHCWVADKRARLLSNELRTAILNYLTVRMISGENAGKRVDEVTNPLHPALNRAKREVCEELFREFVVGAQGMLDTETRIKDMLSFIHDINVRQTLLQRLTTGNGAKLTGVEKWDRIRQELLKHHELRPTLDYIIFHYTYPRLDVNVSKDVGHLLKGPFCVHPGTGRVCVPFRSTEVDAFRPALQAPQLSSLLNDLNGQVPGGEEGENSIQMAVALEVFEEFVKGIGEETARIARKQKLQDLDKKAVVDFIAA